MWEDRIVLQPSGFVWSFAANAAKLTSFNFASVTPKTSVSRNISLLIYADLPASVRFLIPRSFGAGGGSKHVRGVDLYDLDFGVRILFHFSYLLYYLLITEFL